jgi:hypothetical protein
MDFLITLFARCMALTVVAMPFCAFASIDVRQKERSLQDVKFDFSRPAADFRQAVDKQRVPRKNKAHRPRQASITMRVLLGCLFVLSPITCFLALILKALCGPVLFPMNAYPLILLPVLIVGALLAFAVDSYWFGSLDQVNSDPMFINKN